jgi:hypothetical protein
MLVEQRGGAEFLDHQLLEDLSTLEHAHYFHRFIKVSNNIPKKTSFDETTQKILYNFRSLI